MCEEKKVSSLSAKNRILKLLDENSFVELDSLVSHHCNDFDMNNKAAISDGVIIGYGTIDARLIFVYSQDFFCLGGSVGEMHAKKICHIIDLAIKSGAPIVGFFESGGARIQEGINGLSGCGQVFQRNILASGKIPQIAAIMGPCAGSASYSPTLMDFIFMIKDRSYMFLTGPQAIKSCIGETIDFEHLGGAIVHNCVSGVSDFIVESEEECISMIKDLISFLPQNSYELPPRKKISFETKNDSSRNINTKLIPVNSKVPYDMSDLIKTIVDDEHLFEIKAEYAKNVLVGFSRVDGNVIGIFANQPNCMAGALDVKSAKKAAEFIRLCDSFNIPIISFVDVPGFMPGSFQEHNGILKEGAEILFAYSNAKVPKITFILRKAFGGSFLAMGSKELGADFVFALKDAQIGIISADGAVNIIYKKESEEFKKQKQLEYHNKLLCPQYAASQGFIDGIITIHDIRPIISSSLKLLRNKKFYLNEYVAIKGV